jgi:hypothetical protein
LGIITTDAIAIVSTVVSVAIAVVAIIPIIPVIPIVAIIAVIAVVVVVVASTVTVTITATITAAITATITASTLGKRGSLHGEGRDRKNQKDEIECSESHFKTNKAGLKKQKVEGSGLLW